MIVTYVFQLPSYPGHIENQCIQGIQQRVSTH